jgi:hypothetical protein
MLEVHERIEAGGARDARSLDGADERTVIDATTSSRASLDVVAMSLISTLAPSFPSLLPSLFAVSGVIGRWRHAVRHDGTGNRCGQPENYP